MVAFVRPLSSAGALAVAFVVAAGTLPAQQTRVFPRDSARGTILRADTIELRISGANAQELLRQVTELREREKKLVGELRATPVQDVALRRRLTEEFAQLSRESFTLMSVVESFCAEELGPRPEGYLGLSLTRQGEMRRGEVRLGQALVQSVDPGSPAQRAGIISGDHILEIAGRDFRTDMPAIHDLLSVGNRLNVRVERGGKPRDVMVTVARRVEPATRSCGEFERVLQPLRMMGPGRLLVEEPRAGEQMRVTVRSTPEAARTVKIDPIPDGERSFYIFAPGAGGVTDIAFFGGAEFRPLSNSWREVLGMRSGMPGVIVSEVAPGSLAAQAGLRDGDVITTVGAANATSPEVLVRLLTVNDGREAAIKVLRGKETKTLILSTSRRP